ncbi:MAG: hypothetical protein GTO46_08910 [Gemmatimonadetes bacterium]|nr:hypothetical protein [Gemmatimonadota bacterium]NIO31735.1 hypothetical protein [Gemmatimonadota bacterium]
MPQPSLVRRAPHLWPILASFFLFGATDSLAQQGFDLDRAFILDSASVEPFYVTETRSLRQALDEGVINEATPLVVMEHEAGRLAFVVDQLAYHHMAQGDIDGEPWMVSF